MHLGFSSETQNIFFWIQEIIYWEYFNYIYSLWNNQQLSMDVHVQRLTGIVMTDYLWKHTNALFDTGCGFGDSLHFLQFHFSTIFVM